MSSQIAMTTMSAVEFLLSATLGFLFWKKELHRRFPAMAWYLALRVASTPVLTLLLAAKSFTASHDVRQACGLAYFFSFYAIYITSAVILLFVCMEVFRSAMSSLPGLVKFAMVVFRWAVVASMIVTFSSLSFAHTGLVLIPDIALRLMRSVSILELCLLAFLCLCMNALRLSVRDIAFGISLGFGLMSANDFVVVSLISRYTALTAPLQFVYQSLVLVTLGTWVTYCALPEPVRKAVVMPVNSTIYRWNEIASALGHPVTQVAVQPANSFFLHDVEKVVEKVLTRTLKSSESNL
jgi:hypothetical protein